MQLLLKWASVALAPVAVSVPLSSSAATALLVVERSGGVPGFESAAQLSRYLALVRTALDDLRSLYEPQIPPIQIEPRLNRDRAMDTECLIVHVRG
jgi:hypothetical protein